MQFSSKKDEFLYESLSKIANFNQEKKSFTLKEEFQEKIIEPYMFLLSQSNFSEY